MENEEENVDADDFNLHILLPPSSSSPLRVHWEVTPVMEILLFESLNQEESPLNKSIANSITFLIITFGGYL